MFQTAFTTVQYACHRHISSDEETDNLFSTLNFILLITHYLPEMRESQIFWTAES